eukprot:6210307-Pleurochrysis_carterae.AAC.1
MAPLWRCYNRLGLPSEASVTMYNSSGANINTLSNIHYPLWPGNRIETFTICSSWATWPYERACPKEMRARAGPLCSRAARGCLVATQAPLASLPADRFFLARSSWGFRLPIRKRPLPSSYWEAPRAHPGQH